MTHFSLTSLPAIRYASDMPFAVGMVLADDCGATVEVLSVGVTHMVLSGWDGHGIEQGDTRLAYPFLVFVTEMAADAEAQEEERIEALAEAAQWEDDLRNEVLDRAAAEWKRKNPLDFSAVPTPELEARAAAMGVQLPVWDAMQAELDRRQADAAPHSYR